MAENSDPQVFIATKTAHINYGEHRTVITKNVTRVAAGHPLLEKYPDFFRAADEGVRFGVEDAVARPAARTRGRGKEEFKQEGADGAPPADAPVPYADRKLKDLKAEIENRNKSRDAEHQVVIDGRATVASAAAALEADDAATAARAEVDDETNGSGGDGGDGTNGDDEGGADGADDA